MYYCLSYKNILFSPPADLPQGATYSTVTCDPCHSNTVSDLTQMLFSDSK